MTSSDADKDHSYFPHHYTDSVLNNEFKLANFVKMAESMKQNKLYKNMPIEEFNKKVVEQLETTFNRVMKDNPMLKYNSNFLKRNLVNDDHYLKGSMKVHEEYFQKLVDTFRDDMVFLDSLVFKQKAVAAGENRFVIESMMNNYRDRIGNPLLHTNPLQKSKIKSGMEVHFYRMESSEGEVIEREYFGKVKENKANGVVLTSSNGNVTFEKNEIYTKDMQGNKVYAQVNRYKVHGIVEMLDNWRERKGYSKYDGRTILMKAPRFLLSNLNKLVAAGTMGMTAFSRALTTNVLGQSVDTITPYIGKVIKSKLTPSGKQELGELKNRKSVQVGQLEIGLAAQLMPAHTLSLNTLANDEFKTDDHLLGIDPTIKGQMKDYLQLLWDKVGYSSYRKEREGLYKEAMTTDVKKRLELMSQISKLDSDWQKQLAEFSKGVKYFKGNKNFSLAKELDINRATAFFLLMKYMKSISIDKLNRAFNVSENSMRTFSYEMFLLDAYHDNGDVIDQEVIDRAKRGTEYQHGFYDALAKQFGSHSTLGKWLTLFAQFAMERLHAWRKVLPEALSQTLHGGFKESLLASDGKLGKDAPALRRAINMFVASSIITRLLDKVINGLGSTADPMVEAIWQLYDLLGLPDPALPLLRLLGMDRYADDAERKEAQGRYYKNGFMPWFGFGASSTFQYLKDPESMNPLHYLWDKNRSVKTSDDWFKILTKDRKAPSLLKAVTGKKEAWK